MKISSFHKSRGDDVEWVNAFERYDRIYKSKVFTFTPDDLTAYQCPDIRIGGTGYNIKSRLPDDIEAHRGMDYTIYPNHPYSIQFYSRGCIRQCPFCLVHDKEGGIKSVNPVEWNPQAQWIEVLDNNFFASPDWRDAIQDLSAQRLPVKFHGVDVRIMDEEQAEALNKIKLKGYVHIAWDLPQLDLTPRLEAMVKYIKPYKIACYVLVGFNSKKEQDLYRLNTLKRLGIIPFVQPFRDYRNKRRPTQYEKDLARWANRAWLFKSMDFEEFEPRKGFKCKHYFNNS
mgnify:CR=1 FL=1